MSGASPCPSVQRHEPGSCSPRASSAPPSARRPPRCSRRCDRDPDGVPDDWRLPAAGALAAVIEGGPVAVLLPPPGATDPPLAPGCPRCAGARRADRTDPCLAALLAEPTLTETAEVLLDRAGSASRAASTPQIHRQTRYYRLSRIEARTAPDLADGEGRLLHTGRTVARRQRSV
jgi:hypothetical protein